MEQLRQLGGRLLGKKRVAVILGLLGLYCPSSLWAEKLDTTFVLDMVIDSTPCYFTQYNNKGRITQYDIYQNSSSYSSLSTTSYALIDNDDFSHINIGYITDMTGEKVDTIYYIRDKVTKQWIEKKDFPNYKGYSPDKIELRFYNNGMLESIYGSEFVNSSTSGHVEFSESGELKEYSNVFHLCYTWDIDEDYLMNYDSFGNITLEYRLNSSSHKGGVAESSSSYVKTIYKNQYDNKYNLIEVEEFTESRRRESSLDAYSSDYDVKGTSRRKMEHSYDSQNRRIKTITYDYIGSNYVLRDSTIYSYGHALHEGEACLLSLMVSGKTIDSFSPDKYHYDLSDRVYREITYRTPFGSSAETFYDWKTGQVTIHVQGNGSSQDSSNTSIYTIKFATPESYITSMTNDGEPVEGFSQDKYEYDFMDLPASWSWNLDYEFSLGSTVEKSYDDSTNTLSIRVYGADFKQDSSNVHTYSIRCKAPESYLTSLSFNGSPVDNFSPTTFKYTLGGLYSPQGRTFSYTAFPGSIVTSKVYETSLHITVENEIIHQKNEYIIDFPLIEDVCLTSLSINGNPVDGFSWDKYEYDFSDSLEYHEGEVSYTSLQPGVIVNGIYNGISDDFYRLMTIEEEYYDYDTDILRIHVTLGYVSWGGSVLATNDSKTTYVIKFKKSKPETFLTSLKLDEIPIDTFSKDNYIYDLSDYSFSAVQNGGGCHKEVSNCRDDGYYIVLSKPKFFNDDTYGIYNSTLRWSNSKYSTFDVSYEEKTGVISITVKGEDYKEDSSNIHVYKILTKKIDSLSIYSFEVVYYSGEEWSNNVNVIANEHEYKAFSPYPTDFTYGRFSYSTISNVDVTMDNQYSEEAHTIYYIFSHRTIQSLVDTYSVVLQPCVTSILVGENLTYEAIDKLEHYINREYKAEEFKYELPAGVVATESYDDSTNILTLTARFGTGDTTSKTEYHIHFRPVDGVDDFLGDQVKLYVTDKTICVDGAEEPISVYNLLGTLVGTGRGEEARIPVSQAGVYVVKAGGKAAKVVVK